MAAVQPGSWGAAGRQRRDAADLVRQLSLAELFVPLSPVPARGAEPEGRAQAATADECHAPAPWGSWGRDARGRWHARQEREAPLHCSAT